MSRGTTRRSARAADEAAVEAPLDEDHGARRRHLAHPADDRDRVAGFAKHVGEPRRLVRREDDPGPIRAPRVDRLRDAPRPARWQDGFAPAEWVARRESAACHRRVLGRDGLPGELERP